MTQTSNSSLLMLKPSRAELIQILQSQALKQLDKKLPDIEKASETARQASVSARADMDRWWLSAQEREIGIHLQYLNRTANDVRRRVLGCIQGRAKLANLRFPLKASKPTRFQSREYRDMARPYTRQYDFGVVELAITFDPAPKKLRDAWGKSLKMVEAASAKRAEYDRIKGKILTEPLVFIINDLADVDLEDLRERAGRAISRLLEGAING